MTAELIDTRDSGSAQRVEGNAALTDPGRSKRASHYSRKTVGPTESIMPEDNVQDDHGESSTEQTTPVRYACTLVFTDGQTVTAQISARCRCDEGPVAYKGAAKRLPFTFDVCDSVLLRATFLSFARKLNADFREEIVGEWRPPKSFWVRALQYSS